MIQKNLSASSQLISESELLYAPIATNLDLESEYSDNYQNKKLRKIKCSKKWTIEENQFYLHWLLLNIDSFVDEKSRRASKIYKHMSDFMNNKKTPEQCRGHHKKLLENYHTLENIITAINHKICNVKRKRVIKKAKRSYVGKSETKNPQNLLNEEITPKESQRESQNQQKPSQCIDSQVCRELAFVETFLTLE